jgi:hypothetical protein
VTQFLVSMVTSQSINAVNAVCTAKEKIHADIH